MTGRGIDQILPHPVPPRLHESYVKDARDYVRLAEAVSGAVEHPVSWDYVWGDALAVLESQAPDARVVNLETSITLSDEPWPGKAVHYRMSPANVRCLVPAALSCCVLANNHVLDWGSSGLLDTCATLREAGIRFAGAGADLAAATAPAEVPLRGGRRLLVFAAAFPSSGVPHGWAAGRKRPGVNFIATPSSAAARGILAHIDAYRRSGDRVVVSLHWGSNWGYTIPTTHVEFAHALIDGGVDVVHGHSSHHPRGVEVYGERPVLYGCGDLLNDYEGIGGFDEYRGELTLLYLVRLHADSGELMELSAVPFQVRRLRLERAGAEDARWQAGRLTRASSEFDVEFTRWDGQLVARWSRRG